MLPTLESDSTIATDRGDMARERIFIASTVLIGALSLIHALVTWPSGATIALFAAGGLVAFLGEAIAIRAGFVEHYLGRSVWNVPLYVLGGWVGVTYVAFRVALLITDGIVAVLVAASLATIYDVTVDHTGVERGYWSYPADPPGPRHRGVPWWNYAGWFLFVCVTTAITMPWL